MRNKQEIEDACENFLQSWNRGEWMVQHGTWESENWEHERGVYNDAVDALDDVTRDAEHADMDDVISAAKDLIEAAEALEGQVTPDGDDYIEEGTIDPDCVEGRCTDLDVGTFGQGWDCREGWDAHRCDESLVLHWWREPYGGSNRHARDLWIVIDDEFFEGDDDDDDDEDEG